MHKIKYRRLFFKAGKYKDYTKDMKGTKDIYPSKSIGLSFESTQDSRVCFLLKLVNLSLHVTMQLCGTEATADFALPATLLLPLRTLV